MTYSIIIPHKNVPELLIRLLNTIPQREDTEVIIVDDNSSEKIVDFSVFPGINKKNTKCIFLKQDKGAGFARNKGIEVASGKWLLFADADDFYTENFNAMLDKYANDDVNDIVYINAQSFFEINGKTEALYYTPYFSRYKERKTYSEKVLRYNIFTPWSRMVKKKLITQNNLLYEEIPVGNDKMFCLRCSKFANRIDIEENVIYNYFRPNKGSTTCSYSKSIDNLKSKLSLQLRANKLFDEVGYIFKYSFIYDYLRNSKKNNNMTSIYRSFMKENQVSYVKDACYMILTIAGRLIKIL